MLVHDEAFDAKFTPEYGQVEDEDAGSEGSPEDGQEPDEEDDYDEDEDDEGTEDSSLEVGAVEEDEEDNISYVPKAQYDELRKFATQKSMELAELKKTAAVANTVPTQPGIQKPLDDLINERVAKALERYAEPMRQQEEDLAIQMAIKAISDRDPDFQGVSPGFLKTLEESPQLFEVDNGIELAYMVAKASYLERVSSAKVKAETKEALRRKEMKSQLSEAGNQGTARQETVSVSPEDAIRASILGAGGSRPF